MLFADYAGEKWNWVTAFDAKYYPDHFLEALELYSPIIARFRALAKSSGTSEDLLRRIQQITEKERVQLLKLFRRYVSPNSSVEMLKKKRNTEGICRTFGPHFRPIGVVRANIDRPDYDVAVSVLLFEHKDRGIFGYDLTQKFFAWFEARFPRPPYQALGPRRAGADIELSEVFPDYPHRCPSDIVIKRNELPILVGFARYDSDRGGSQEDDRTGGNQTKVLQIIEYAETKGINVRILFLNDGPGLLLGSMWRDYGEIEKINPKRILVATLKMLPVRLTEAWMTGSPERSV